MVRERINPDPCDVRIIEFSNCMQCLASICECLAMCYEDLQEGAECVRFVHKESLPSAVEVTHLFSRLIGSIGVQRILFTIAPRGACWHRSGLQQWHSTSHTNVQTRDQSAHAASP
eukprot:SAG31_NODE_4288_length_3377_cov_4.228493_3_plen_116_part_00